MEPYTPDADHRARLLLALAAMRECGNKTLEASLIAALNGSPRTADQCVDVPNHPENPQI